MSNELVFPYCEESLMDIIYGICEGKDMDDVIPHNDGKRIGQFITLFKEIAELKKTEEVMKKHKLLFECAQDAVLYVGDDGKVMDANESAHKLYGYSHEEFLSLSVHNIRHPSTRSQFEHQMRQADETGVVFESIHIKKDGTEFPVEVSAKGTTIGSMKVRIHIIRDITERKAAEEKIIYLATHDPLTGIPNRAYIRKETEKALELAGRGNYRLALLLFDIDKFKQINDIYGHPTGDTVLKTVAARTKAVIRNTDTVARLGGDEFVILMPMIKSKKDILSLIERMFKAFDEPITIDGGKLKVHISVGVSIYPSNASDREGLVRCADASMYEAKMETGNSYQFYPINAMPLYREDNKQKIGG